MILGGGGGGLGWQWSVTLKNNGQSKKTEWRTGQKTRVVVLQWVPTFKEAVPPPPFPLSDSPHDPPLSVSPHTVTPTSCRYLSPHHMDLLQVRRFPADSDRGLSGCQVYTGTILVVALCTWIEFSEP